jgi:hypothetical protein
MKRMVFALMMSAVLVGCSEETNKTLSAEEQLALQYVEQFQNGKDVAVKKKFLEEHVHEDTKPLMSIAANAPSADDAVLHDVQVVGSTDYEKSGKKGKTVLIRGKNNKDEAVEEIFIFIDGKFAWGVTEASDKNTFQQLRLKFE